MLSLTAAHLIVVSVSRQRRLPSRLSQPAFHPAMHLPLPPVAAVRSMSCDLLTRGWLAVCYWLRDRRRRRGEIAAIRGTTVTPGLSVN